MAKKTFGSQPIVTGVFRSIHHHREGWQSVVAVDTAEVFRRRR